MGIVKRSILFCAGGGAYVALELLWRGRSHVSMFLAGGLCLLLIGHLGEVEPKLPFAVRVLIGAVIITAVELGVGLAVNRTYRIWDYRDRWGNFLGQICPAFCLLWLPVSALAIVVYERLAKWLGDLSL